MNEWRAKWVYMEGWENPARFARDFFEGATGDRGP